MPQTAKMIDVSRSYIPIDPNTYAANLALSRYQDAPDQASPIVAYDGKNFIPTISGYKSYFGIDRAVQTDSLPSRADHVISFQNAAYQNILVAMCEDGIYIKHGADYGAWVKKVSVETSGGQYKEWSYCVLADAIYCYRTNDLQYYCIPSKVASANLEFYPMAPYMHIQTEAGSQYDPMPVGTYSFKVMGQLKAGWVTALSAASAELTLTTPSSILLWINEANVTKYSDKYAFIRFYITKGAVTKYIDVVATSADIAQVRLTATAWGSAQVVTEVPDEDMLSKPFTASQPVIGITPSFLNMAGQLGIFSAGTRLGFWDSEDSVSWSSMDDYTDFTPSLTTLAGSAIFSDVAGRIVTIQQLGDGFVIYSTQSIVYVAKEEGQLLLWSPKQLAKIGLSYRKQVTPSYYKHEHYAWTGDGLMRVAAGQVELIVPEVLDLMKKHNAPVYPELIDGRYLCLQIMDKDFELRRVLSTEITIEGETIAIGIVDTEEEKEEAIDKAMQYVYNPFDGYDRIEEVVEAAHSPVNVVVNNPPLQRIYDWELSVGSADKPSSHNGHYLYAAIRADTNCHVAPMAYPGYTTQDYVPKDSSPIAAATYYYNGVLITDPAKTSSGVLVYNKYTRTIFSNPDIGNSPDRLRHIIPGTAQSRKDKVADFVTMQVELWNRGAARQKEQLQAFMDYVSSLVGYQGSSFANMSNLTDIRVHIDLFSKVEAIAAARIRELEALFTPAEANTPTGPFADKVIGYIIAGYSPAELEITATGVALQRRITKVQELKIVHNKGKQSMPIDVITTRATMQSWMQVGTPFSGNAPPPYPNGAAIFAGYTFAEFDAYVDADVAATDGSDTPLETITASLQDRNDSTMGNALSRNASVLVTYTSKSDNSVRQETRYYLAILYNVGDAVLMNTASIIRGATLVGNFGVDRGEMVLTKYYDPQSGNEYPVNAVPFRGPYLAGTYELDEDAIAPATGIMGAMTKFNYYNLTVDSVWPNLVPLTWTPLTGYVAQFPDYEFVLQEGSPAPAYPTFYGAYVYDLFLKKWGKLDQEYSLLLNYSAINGQNGQPVSFNAFQMNSGILDTYGAIRLFDDKPSESFIRYGKIGYDRKGFTAAEEVRVGFSSPSTCTVALEPSITGVSIEKNLKDSVSVVSANGATLFANLSARWYNVTISGKYDINYLEFRGHSSGRR